MHINPGQLVSTLGNWFQPRATGFNSGQLVSTLGNWFQPRATVFNPGQLVSTLGNWFQLWATGFNSGQLVSTLGNWFQPGAVGNLHRLYHGCYLLPCQQVFQRATVVANKITHRIQAHTDYLLMNKTHREENGHIIKCVINLLIIEW